MTDNVSRADAVAALVDEITNAVESERKAVSKGGSSYSWEFREAILIERLTARIEALPAAPAAAAPLLTPAPTVEVDEWVLDVRVGMAAVYRGPRRNCLSGISCDQDCVFVARGAWINGAWVIDDDDRARALRCYAALRGRGEEVVVAEGAYDDASGYVGPSLSEVRSHPIARVAVFNGDPLATFHGQRVQVIVRKIGATP